MYIFEVKFGSDIEVAISGFNYTSYFIPVYLSALGHGWIHEEIPLGSSGMLSGYFKEHFSRIFNPQKQLRV